jgi:hypothetical protein
MSILHLLASTMSGGLGVPAPAFGTSPNISSSVGGACNAGGGVQTPGSQTTTWTVLNQNAAYGLKIYRNGVLKSTVAISAVSFTNSETGVITDSRHPYSVDWVFRVDIYLLSDGSVIQSASTAHWIADYGNCTGPF